MEPRHFFHTVRDPFFFYLYNDTILSKELACHLHFSVEIRSRIFVPNVSKNPHKLNGWSLKATISIFYCKCASYFKYL